MSTITEISAAVTHNVSALPKTGSNDRVYIITETGWQSTSTTVSAGQVTAITGTNVAEKWEGANSSVNFTVENVKVSQHDGWTHRLNLRVYDKTAANIAQIVALCQSGHVRVVVETNGGSQNGGLFWLLGYRTGLSIVPGTQWDQSSTDEAGFLLELSTPEDESAEPYYPYQVIVTDHAGTVTALDALI